MTCPFCDGKAVDVTTSAETIRRYICTGSACHEWNEGDGPEPEPEPKPTGFLNKFKQFFA